MTRMMLERKGYTVLSAGTPTEAMEKAKNHSGAIDMLMTDVVMPEMNDRDLAGQITRLYTDIRLLFMPGYTANVIAHQGILDDGVAFIQKPFSMADMTVKIRELLLNVIKHSGVKSAHLEMTCDEVQKQLRVTVSDNGSGFDRGAVLKNEGTGFGLFSIQERLQLMGGSIRIKSSPRNGASLSLIMPLEKKEEEEDEVIQEIKTENKITKTGGDIIRTLVVDDHTVVHQGISAMLSFNSDIEMVGEAGDGQEAVEKARQLHPDVILMDINMPRMDGIQATRIIHSELPYVRIIGLSMHDKQDQADQMIQAGASTYCTKDGSTDELLSAIRRLD